jgi:transposase
VGELSPASRDLALRRFRLLEPHLEHDRSLRVIAAEAGIPFRTVQRWAGQYRRFGLVALVRKKRHDKGARRTVSAKLKAAIEGLALERPPFQSLRYTVRSKSLQLRRVKARLATGLSIASSVTCRKVSLFSLTKAIRATVKTSILFTVARRRSQTVSGKPTTRNSISFSCGKMEWQRDRG